MQITKYVFQTPSSSQVQIGRPDPSTPKEDAIDKTENITNQAPKNSTKFDMEQTRNIQASNKQHILNTYA